jgi:hypothetical protein
MDSVVLDSIRNLAQRKAGQIRQKVMLGDLHAAQMALGGQLALEELERDLHWRDEANERVRADQHQRQLRRKRAATAAIDLPGGAPFSLVG